MAINDVPLGVAGTGGAYYLPESRAIYNIPQYFDDRKKEQQQAELLRQQKAQALAASWKDNQLNIKAGTLWQPEIDAAANDAMQTGMQLRASGINPTQFYQNPKVMQQIADYNNKRNKALHMAEARDAFATQANEQNKLMSTAVPGDYDSESVQRHNDFFKTPLSEIMAKGYQMPLISKAFNPETALEKIAGVSAKKKTIINGHEVETTIPNLKAHGDQAKYLVQNDPQFQSDFQKAVGLPYSSVNSVSNKNDLAGITADVDAHLRSNLTNENGKTNKDILLENGIDSYNSPQYKAFVENTAKNLFDVKKKSNAYLNNIVSRQNAKVGTQFSSLPYFGYEDQIDKREARSQRNARFAHDKEGWDANTGVSFNVPGTVAEPGEIGAPGQTSPVTHPVMLPNINKNLTVAPKEVFNPITGHFGSNTAPITAQLGSPILTPMLEVGGNKKLLSDADVANIQKGKFNINGKPVSDKNITYRYMVPGMQTKQIPVMEDGQDEAGNPIKKPSGKFTEQKIPINFDMSSINSKLYDKDINYHAFEDKLSDFVRNRIARPGNGHNAVKKTATAAQIKALVGTAGYEDYSEKELANYYKGLGYTITP